MRGRRRVGALGGNANGRAAVGAMPRGDAAVRVSVRCGYGFVPTVRNVASENVRLPGSEVSKVSHWPYSR